MPHCRVPGCIRTATRFGGSCSTHKTRARRHGHPLQEGVTKAQLAPYLAVVRRRKERNPDNPFWGSLRGRWGTLMDHCRGVIAAFNNGQPMNRHERQACQEIIMLADHVEAAAVVETALAVFLMHEQAPRRFLSDDAFRHQLARRVRGLTEVNAGSWYDHRSGRVKRVYRDLPAKTTLAVGRMLAETFGVAGLLLARKEEQDVEKRRAEVQALADAVAALE